GIALALGKARLHAAPHAPILPPVVQDHGGDQRHPYRNQQNLQVTHKDPRLGPAQAASPAHCSAESISTATIRETPCSCMVTPMSWRAICMAILLWEMNRNCVWWLMLRTRLA